MSDIKTKTLSSPPVRLEKMSMNIMTVGSVAAGIVAATVTLTNWLSAKPDDAKVKVIAETAARTVIASAETRLALVEAESEHTNRKVDKLEKSIDKFHDKIDGVLMLTAEQRGPRTLRRVKENLASGASPTEGVITE